MAVMLGLASLSRDFTLLEFTVDKRNIDKVPIFLQRRAQV